MPIGNSLYKNKSEKGGRPNISIIIMTELLILQQLYGLSDPQLELQVADRISFRVFLGTTEVIPDYSTIWLFRERLKENDKLEAIWEEFVNQLKAKGYDASMKRAARGHQLSVFDELRNKRISRKRSPVERCFSVIKIVFRAGHVMVTTVERAAIKITFSAIGYNLYNLLGWSTRNPPSGSFRDKRKKLKK